MSLPMRGGMLRYHSRADLRNRLPECVAGHSSNTLKTYRSRSEEHTSELQSRLHLVCRLLLEKKKIFRYKRKSPRLNSRKRNSSRTVYLIPHVSAYDVMLSTTLVRQCTHAQQARADAVPLRAH